MTVEREKEIRRVHAGTSGSVSYLLAALDECRRERDEARLRTPGRFCEVCWSSSWSPCPEGTKDAVKDPDRPGWMRCDQCATHDALTKCLRYRQAVEQTLLYVSNNVGSGDHVEQIQAEVDGLLKNLGVK